MPDVVSPLLASFVRQSETLLVDVTLSVRQKLSKNCTEFYLVERQVRESHRRVLSEQRCSMESHLCVPMARTVKAALVLVTKDGTFLCTEALLPKGIYCRSSILRVANDRISCARKHLCSKARTVLAVLYVRHKGRHFSSEGLVQTALVHKGNQGHTRCLFMFNVTWTNPAS